MSSTDDRIIRATRSPKLANATPIAIGEALLSGMIILGLKGEKRPDKEMLVALVNECKTYHGALGFEELKLAFEMAARMQLEFDPETYQSFSLLYLNKMLDAYKRRATPVAQTFENTVVEEGYSPKIFMTGTVNDHRGRIQKGYEDFLTGHLQSVIQVPYEWYRQLVDDGFIEYDPHAFVTENIKCSELQYRQDIAAKLKIGQQYVWDLFSLARDQQRSNIYVYEPADQTNPAK